MAEITSTDTDTRTQLTNICCVHFLREAETLQRLQNNLRLKVNSEKIRSAESVHMNNNAFNLISQQHKTRTVEIRNVLSQQKRVFIGDWTRDSEAARYFSILYS